MPASGATADYLRRLGERVREARERRGMTRRILTKDSGVSERYLAQLEAGQGNVSILLLRQIARALDIPVETLVHDGPEPPIEFLHAAELLKRLDARDLARAHQLLLEKFAAIDPEARRTRIALIGMRGAGKSTLGRMLSVELQLPFIELDRMIEQDSGVPLSVIFDLYGQSGYRRFERQCLEHVIERHSRFVIATGGSLVTVAATFERLLAACFTIWLRAAPEDHMKRVIAQGDMRPMAENKESMSDLVRILAGREIFYGKADAVVDTSGHSLPENLEALKRTVKLETEITERA